MASMLSRALSLFRSSGKDASSEKAITVPSTSGSGGWFNIIREPYSGAWQRNAEEVAPVNLLAFSAVYACVTIIASDIATLRLKLTEWKDGIWSEIADRNSPFLPVLRKPNHYQTRIKFVEQIIVSKLLYGNAYILKQRDARGIVTALYVLDPQRVVVKVADDGSVWYELKTDILSELVQAVVVPASEIIHDMMTSFWHPLVGVSPIFACGGSASMGNKIQNNSSVFFTNMSRPSGILSAPGAIADETAARLKANWETNFSGGNIGRLAVLGDGLKYEAMTIPPQAAQLIEQLKWTVEDVARAFHMPLYKLGAEQPTYNNVGALKQLYYDACLKPLIESAELCLDEGLSLPSNYGIQFDLSGLLRMDATALFDSVGKAIKDGWMSPNEARALMDMSPVEGGETPYMQQQNWSLADLATRDIINDKPGVDAPGAAKPDDPPDDPPDDSADDSETVSRIFAALVEKELSNVANAA